MTKWATVDRDRGIISYGKGEQKVYNIVDVVEVSIGANPACQEGMFTDENVTHLILHLLLSFCNGINLKKILLIYVLCICIENRKRHE